VHNRCFDMTEGRRNMPPIVVFAFVSLTIVFPLAAAAQSHADAANNGAPNASGFLKDYARLKPVEGKEGRYAWTAPDADLKQYTRFLLPPMEIWIDRDAQYRGLSADVVQRIANIYQTSFTQVLAPQFTVVKQAGPGVAACRFAITGVTPERPQFTPLDIVPIKAAFTLVRAATGTSAQVARVSAEIECEDSVSHQLLLEAVITGAGQRKFVEGQPITWTDVEPVLASWAQDFKARLNFVQGR
jgi:hypothetical protein